MKASVAIQVLPKADNDQELVRIVDEVIAYIKSTGLHCSVGPFETTIEGESYDQLMEIVTQCQKVAIKAGAPSVSAYVKIVYNPEGEVLTIDRKAPFTQNGAQLQISKQSSLPCVLAYGSKGMISALRHP